MLQSVNLQEVKEKLYIKLKESGWSEYIKTFVLSSEMDTILESLLNDALDNKRFTPKIKDLFRAFEVCPFDNVNVVIIGQDPYPQEGVADGVAFSCSNTGKPEASLRYIFDSIKRTVGVESSDCDLSRWSKQGILLLNTAFTTTIGKPGTHQLLWKPFTVAVLDALIWNKPNLIYVFMGKHAQAYADLIPDNNYKIMTTHPASAAYTKQSQWNCDDVWNKINSCLEKQNKPKIVWEI
jgi:uracil-DNA glycosylase